MSHCFFPGCKAEMVYSETGLCWKHLFLTIVYGLEVLIWSLVVASWVWKP